MPQHSTPNTRHPLVLISSIAACQSIIVHSHSARTRIKIPLVLRLADTFTGGLCALRRAARGRQEAPACDAHGQALTSPLRCGGKLAPTRCSPRGVYDRFAEPLEVSRADMGHGSVARSGFVGQFGALVCWEAFPSTPYILNATEAVRDSANRNITWMHEMVPGQTPNALVEALPPDPSARWPLAAKADMGVY
jgi:hypothetical protein